MISGSDATRLDISLDFLGAGRWQASQLREDQAHPDAWNQKGGSATHKDILHIQLAPRGGFVGWLRQLQ